MTTLWVERTNGGMERILSNLLPPPGVLGPCFKVRISQCLCLLSGAGSFVVVEAALGTVGYHSIPGLRPLEATSIPSPLQAATTGHCHLPAGGCKYSSGSQSWQLARMGSWGGVG